MQKLFVSLLVIATIALAGNLDVEKLTTPTNGVLEPVQTQTLDEELVVTYTGITSTPPWIQLDPPWDPGVTFVDFSNRNDTWISMDVDINDRIYVVYQTPWTGTGGGVRYGWGVATSTDQGLTWDNRVYRVGSTTYSEFEPEIDITDDGKIWIWGTLNGGTYSNCPAFLRSSMTCYNNPDSLRGFGVFNIPQRRATECVTYGTGDQLCIAQFTVDQAAAGADSVSFLFTQDSINFWILTWRPPGGNIGNTSIAINVNGADTMLTHAVEFVDTANGDWDVIWYHDTMGVWNLWGMVTGNPNNDRYPSVFGDQYSTYLAFQGDIGGGNNEILFTWSIDWGATWDPTLQNISNDGQNDQYPRLHGIDDIIGLAYNHGIINVFFNYSILNGQPGSWQAAPEIASSGATADTGYHCVGLLYTPTYYYCAWEDTRNMATDSIDIFISRRFAPIGVVEQDQKTLESRTLLLITPNPSNEHTYITCGSTIPMNRASLKIYSAEGRLVRTLDIPRNRTAAVLNWDGCDQNGVRLGAGIYFCELNVNGSSQTKKIIRVR